MRDRVGQYHSKHTADEDWHTILKSCVLAPAWAGPIALRRLKAAMGKIVFWVHPPKATDLGDEDKLSRVA